MKESARNLNPNFTVSLEPEPHKERRRKILASHPEVRALVGPARVSVLYIFGIVAFQFGAAWLLRESPWWLMLPAAYVIGAVANHALFVMIHECTHNLVWQGTRANRILGMIANLPLVFPAAMSFRKYHLLHHKYQGEFEYDADLPGPDEARLIGHSTIKKALWMLFFLVVEALRPMRIKAKLWDGWTVVNLVVMVAVSALVVRFMSWEALFYLTLSTFFGVGLHPVGARWIQEHFIIREGQETNSYYGPWNRFAFNVGYHNEHHDLMTVPWFRLPRLRAMAPEFYDGLYYHKSWSRLALRFIFDSSLGLDSRVIRTGAVGPATARTPIAETAKAVVEPAPSVVA
jgi:sphingolipid delta-4 desaturase